MEYITRKRARRRADRPGYCYLALFSHRWRLFAEDSLGSWPTLQRVLRLEPYFHSLWRACDYTPGHISPATNYGHTHPCRFLTSSRAVNSLVRVGSEELPRRFSAPPGLTPVIAFADSMLIHNAPHLIFEGAKNLLASMQALYLSHLPLHANWSPVLPSPPLIDWEVIRSMLPHFPPEIAGYLQLLLDHGFALDATFTDITAWLFHAGQLSYDIGSFIHPLFRVYAYYTQNYDQFHGTNRAWDRAKEYALPAPLPPRVVEMFTSVVTRALLSNSRDIATLDPKLYELQRLAATFSEVNQIQSEVAVMAKRQIAAIMMAHTQKPAIHAPSSANELQLTALAAAFPTARVLGIDNQAPHAFMIAARYGMEMLIATNLRSQFPDAPVRLIAGSLKQVSIFPNTCHNCAPILDGRDDFRYLHRGSQVARDFHAKVSCRSRHVECDLAVVGAVTVSLNVHDESFSDLITGMIRTGSSTAFLVQHLPVPFLDGNVNFFHDPILEVNYRRHKSGAITMAFADSSTLGYANDAEAMMSYALPLPLFKGKTIMIDELARVGTLFAFRIDIGSGDPTLTVRDLTIPGEQFYHLPEFTFDTVRGKSRPQHFAVPVKRFDTLKAYAQTLGDGLTRRDIGIKLRGLQAEIKIGNQVLAKRWDISSQQFDSLTIHVLLASMMSDRLITACLARGASYYQAWFNRLGMGSPGSRVTQYIADVFSLQVSSKRDIFSRSLSEQVTSFLLADNFDHGEMYNPYVRCTTYHIVNEVRAGVRSGNLVDIVSDVVEVSQFAARTATSVFEAISRSVLPGPATAVVPSAAFRLPHRTGPFFAPPAMLTRAALDSAAVSRAIMDRAAEIPLPESPAMTPPRTPAPSLPVSANTSGCSTPVLISSLTRSCTPLGSITATSGVSTPSTFDSMGGVLERPATPPIVAPIPPIGVPMAVQSGFVPLVRSIPKVYATLNLSHERAESLLSNTVIDHTGTLGYRVRPRSSRAHIDFVRVCPDATQLDILLSDGATFPAPDAGAATIIRRALSAPLRTYKLDRGMRAMRFDELPADTPEPIVNKNISFFEAVSLASGNAAILAVPTIIIDGIAASAKSTALRRVLKPLHTMVVCPTNMLCADWRSSGFQGAVTKHAIPGFNSLVDLLVIDEVFALDQSELLGWLVFAAARRWQVILIGDRYQSARLVDAFTPETLSMMRFPTMRFFVSCTMGIDALALSLSVFSAADQLLVQTLNPDTESVRLFIQEEQDFALGDYPSGTLTMVSLDKNRPMLLPKAPSVSQAQGLRPVNAVWYANVANHKRRTLAGLSFIRYVALSRAKSKTILHIDNVLLSWLFPSDNFIGLSTVNGYDPASRLRYPFDLDNLVAPVSTVDFASSPYSRHIGAEINVSANIVPDEAPAHRSESLDHVTEADLLATVAAMTAPESIAHLMPLVDFYAPVARGLRSIALLEHPEPPALLSSIDGVASLANIQLSSNTFEDARNMVLRQLIEKKDLSSRTADIILEAQTMLRHYAISFFKKQYTARLTEDFFAEWVESRTSGYLVSLINAAPLGEDAASLVHTAFQKKQNKVKAEDPAAPFGLSYGQEIIGSSPAWTAFYAASSRGVNANLVDVLRDDVIMDIGFSDAELSRLCRERGMFAKFRQSFTNLDISKQDSSHTAPHVLMFSMLAKLLGADEDAMDLYYLKRSTYRVNSLRPHLFACVVEFNLPSGDFFTLTANGVQATVTISQRYENVASHAYLHKGDDDETDDGELIPRASCVPCCEPRIVTIKVDRSVQYHAGRFMPADRWIADPFRIFSKHFSRLQHSEETIDEFYVSFLSRQANYTAFETRYLHTVASRLYKHLNFEKIDTIIRVVSAMHDPHFFSKFYTQFPIPSAQIVSPISECVYYSAKVYAKHAGIACPSRSRLADLNAATAINRLRAALFPVYFWPSLAFRTHSRSGVHLDETHAIAIIPVLHSSLVSQGVLSSRKTFLDPTIVVQCLSQLPSPSAPALATPGLSPALAPSRAPLASRLFGAFSHRSPSPAFPSVSRRSGPLSLPPPRVVTRPILPPVSASSQPGPPSRPLLTKSGRSRISPVPLWAPPNPSSSLMR